MFLKLVLLFNPYFISLMSKLYPLWLFLCGFLAGTQFSLKNYPVVCIISFSIFYGFLSFFRYSLSKSIISAFAFGYGFFSYSHSWISHPLTAFGDVYISIKPAVFILVPAVLSLYFILIGALNYLLRLEGVGRVFALSVATVFMEYMRCEYAPAVPLGQIGSIWISATAIIQSAAVFGLYGLSFITVFLSYSMGDVPAIYQANPCIRECVCMLADMGGMAFGHA